MGGGEKTYLFDGSLVDTTTFVDEMTSRSGLSRVDVADNDPAQEKRVRTRPKVGKDGGNMAGVVGKVGSGHTH